MIHMKGLEKEIAGIEPPFEFWSASTATVATAGKVVRIVAINRGFDPEDPILEIPDGWMFSFIDMDGLTITKDLEMERT